MRFTGRTVRPQISSYPRQPNPLKPLIREAFTGEHIVLSVCSCIVMAMAMLLEGTRSERDRKGSQPPSPPICLLLTGASVLVAVTTEESGAIGLIGAAGATSAIGATASGATDSDPIGATGATVMGQG